jgi:Raf kinase inhibitor-like YbhB/YbcL family protein
MEKRMIADRKMSLHPGKTGFRCALLVGVLTGGAWAMAQNGAPSAGGPPPGMQGPPDIKEILAHPPILTFNRPMAKTDGKLTVTSKTFGADGKIPLINTSYGKSISPEVSWSAGPAGTKSYLLIMEDATAGMNQKGVLHWMAFNIPPQVTNLPEGLPNPPAGMVMGGDQRGKAGYTGPSAPAGAPPFHYSIQIYAMDCLLNLSTGATRDAVWTAMEGHVLAKGSVEGTFQGPASAKKE